MALPGRHHGLLSLDLVCQNGQTAIARQRSHPPLQIFGLQRLPDDRGAYLQIVNPSGVLLEGDSALIEINLHRGTHLYLTTQAATKVYPAEQGEISRQRTRLRVASEAVLEYFPLPLIPFARAMYAQEIAIQVEGGGICLLADVLAPGRVARGEHFAYRMLRSRVEAWVGDRLALFEQMILEPSRRPLQGLGLLEDQAYLATLYVLTSQPLEPHIMGWNQRLAMLCGERGGVTGLAYGGLMARLLGRTAQEVLRWLETLHRWIREEGLGLSPLQIYRPFA
jgi:urease accessory protein